jgi:SET domain-containing protein|tara:strand:- start:52 stop:498 length:447 start_codon:yes stop_codon:yes gene_type:complete
VKLYKIKNSKIDNKGLYASQSIKNRTKIVEYKGKIITKKQVEDNPKFDNGKAIYLFDLNKKYDLDGDFKFNIARLINHSCDPNCEVYGSGLKVWVYAIKDIKKGEELTYDYGFSFDENFKDFPCRCGSKKCVGYIIREGSRWRIKKQK